MHQIKIHSDRTTLKKTRISSHFVRSCNAFVTFSVMLFVMFSVLLPDSALAGLLRVQNVMMGTTVEISATAGGVTLPHDDDAVETNSDGIVEFGLPQEIQQGTNPMVAVTKVPKGQAKISYKLNVVVGGTTLASLEPFEFPTFTVIAGPDILAIVDIVEFLNDAPVFAIGDILGVSNGVIMETDSILFLDPSGLSSDPSVRVGQILDPSILSSLPSFSGSAQVNSFDRLSVPEPTTLTFFSVGLAAVVFLRRRMRKAA